MTTLPVSPSPRTRDWFIYEGGASETVAITLKTQPTADVTFGLTNATPDQVTFSSYSVTFTPANWNVPQVIVITAINNNIAEGGFGIGMTPELRSQC
jgi:hypothetical protein